jgi:hypothetical protein
MGDKTNSTTFVKISNKDIYNEIKTLALKVDSNHEAMMQKAEKLDGKIKVNGWMSGTAITLVIIVIGVLAQHLATR